MMVHPPSNSFEEAWRTKMSEETVKPLTSMKPRQKAFIVALNGGTELQHRLVSMGLHVGKEVEILFPCSHIDDPTIVAAGETRLAIGFGMASQIMVAADPA
jgi:Fe2+ transport system protein FeoA